MRFAQILDVPLDPGGLVEWIPEVVGGRGAMLPDPRPTSHNHESHLLTAHDYRMRTRREGGRESWLGLAIHFDEPLSIPAMRIALTGWIDRHEVLRSQASIDPDTDTLTRVTAGAGQVRLRTDRIGWYANPETMLEQIAGSFDRATAPMTWPAYLFMTIARDDDFTLLLAADHSVIDGYSLIIGAHELRHLYRAAVDGTTDPGLPEVGSYVDFSARERRRADDADDTHPAVALWRSFLRAGRGNIAPFGEAEVAMAAPDDEDDETERPQRSVERLLLDPEQANRFAAVTSAAGGSMQAGVLAALGLTYQDRTGEAEFRCVLPRHTRDEQRWLWSVGWYVGLSPVWLDLSGHPTFDQAVSRATAELKRTRRAAELPFLRLAELIGYIGTPRFVVSYLDTRFAPGAAEADAGGATVLRSHSYSDDEVYLWVNRTPGGLRLSARFPADNPDQPGLGAAVTEYLDAFTALITELGERSTFTAPPGQPINRSVR